MNKLFAMKNGRCCPSSSFGALLTILLFSLPILTSAQDRYLVQDRVNIYAHEADANTNVGTPQGFVAGGDRAATINVTYTGFTPEAQAAFQYAVDIWESLLTSSVTIQVDAQFTALGPGILGSAGAQTIHRNFAGAPLANTWYPQAVANSIAGFDLDPATADIAANFSSTFGFYFGTDGNPGAGQYDFVTVVLHELGHGLGFFGSAYVDTGIGYIQQSGDPYIYDTFVDNGGGTSILSYASGTVALAGQLQSDNLFWTGANGVSANGGNAPLYAPGSWDSGSSYSHLREATYPAGNLNSLMTPQLSSAEAIHTPGPVTLGIFEDMGWTLDAGGCTVLGCTDPAACNYDPSADCDDGSCFLGYWYIPYDVNASGTPMVLACSTPSGYFYANQACAQAIADDDPYCITTDWDGLCMEAYNDCLYGDGCDWYIPITPGDGPAEWACAAPAGYELANQPCAQETILNDPYCVNTNWDSICDDAYNCCVNNNLAGCTVSTACNYDPNACVFDGSCVYPGCQDPIACNYDATAGCDDGSCTYTDSPVIDMTDYDWTLLFDWGCTGIPSAVEMFFYYDQTWAIPTYGETGTWSLCGGLYMHDYEGLATIYVGNWDGTQFDGTMDTGVGNTGCFTLYPVIEGCTDSGACNYDATATVDNGTCTFAQYYIPCDVDASSTPMVLACEAPAGYILADQACAQAIAIDDPYCVTNDWDWICQGAYNCCTGGSPGCTITTACNFDPNACTDNTLCTYPGCTYSQASNYDATAGCDNGTCVFDGCTDPAACNYDANASNDDGSCTFEQYYIPCDIEASGTPMVLACSAPDGYILADQACAQERVDFDPYCLNTDWDMLCQEAYNCCLGAAPGCTVIGACNFDPTACEDDASCVYPGCTYPDATNYSTSAGCDDGSCIFPVPGCPEDLNGDGSVNAGDLLQFLAAFGTVC